MSAATPPGGEGQGARILLVGGAERREEDGVVLRRFIELAGGNRARTIVCGAASNDPAETLELYAELFTAMGASDVHEEAFGDRDAGSDPTLLERLEEATGVFFTGGDQLQITSLVAGTPFGSRLRERLEGDDGFVVAGTSAGAAAMSGTMIVGGPSQGTVRRADVDLAPGLGYWQDAVIDTHFNQRGRVSRLLTVFAHNPQVMGVGIDEDTAVELRPDRRFEVIGSGVVTLLHGPISHSNASNAAQEEALAILGAKLHILPAGYGFDLEKMQPLANGVGAAESGEPAAADAGA